MSLIPVAWPSSESESLVIGSLLHANDIPYFVHGGGFASVLPGIQIGAYNTRTVMVPASLAARAVEVLAALTSSSEGDDSPASVPTDFRGKLRLVVETLLFGWFVPRSDAKATESERDGT